MSDVGERDTQAVEIAERVIADVETHAAEARNALTKELVGYFVPIDQWRAIRALLRTPPAKSAPKEDR